MPRLSIVVPFKKNAAQLESTLLSVLENRPRDCEIILSHDGTYSDPYDLATDELVAVQTESDSSLVGLLNEGMRAACAPVVHVLLPGMIVEPNWIESGLKRFQDPEIAAVAVPRFLGENAKQGERGLVEHWLPRRVVSKTTNTDSVTPFLGGSLFRRRVVLALDGFWDRSTLETAEAEFGLALRALDMKTVVDEDSLVLIPSSKLEDASLTYATGFSAGQLACAYASIDDSITVESLVARIGHLAGGLMSPGTVAERLGWVLGVRDSSWNRSIRNRIEQADEQLAAWRASNSVNSNAIRRAA